MDIVCIGKRKKYINDDLQNYSTPSEKKHGYTAHIYLGVKANFIYKTPDAFRYKCCRGRLCISSPVFLNINKYNFYNILFFM